MSAEQGRTAQPLRAAVQLLALLLCASCAQTCNGCGEPPLAELIELHGTAVERDFAPREGKWEKAEIGASFRLGDGVRAGESAQAVLQLQGGGTVRLPPGTQIRFRKGGADENSQAIDVEMGEAEVNAGSSELALHTREGTAVLAPGAKITVRRAAPGRAVYRVEVGAARLMVANGGTRALARGEVVEVGIGMAIMDDAPPPPAAKPAAAPAPAPAPAAEEAAPPATATPVAIAPGATQPASTSTDTGAEPRAGTNRIGGVRIGDIPPGPERVSLGAPAGESFTVHAARVPLNVAFEVGSHCPDEAVLVLDGKPRARNRGQVTAAIPGGRHRYELYCVDAGTAAATPVVSGSITALRDPATASLPRRAPTSFVEADGKRYTVMYQNLLPKISFSWPDAPPADRYTLRVESNGKPSLFNTRTPDQAFAPGSLRDGTHTLYFTTPAGARSKTTTLEIVYDNAAPKLSLSAPRDGSFTPGTELKIEGVALPGFQVSVQGGTVELDQQARFTGTAVTSAARPDLALRIEKPGAGVHYYIRRAQ